MSVALATPWALRAALLGQLCPAPKKHLYCPHMPAGTQGERSCLAVPVGHQGAPHSSGSAPTSDSSPSYPALTHSFISSSFPHAKTRGINITFASSSAYTTFISHACTSSRLKSAGCKAHILLYIYFFFVWYNQALFLFVSMHHHCNKRK